MDITDVMAGRAPHHLGFVVPDAAAAGDVLISSLGCVRHRSYRLDLSDEHVAVGAAGSIQIVLAELGGLLYEFIEPVGDAPTVWRRALDEGVAGLHHVAYTELPGYDDVVDALRRDGFDISVAGSFPSDDGTGAVVRNRWCYVEKPGFVFELTSGPGPSLDG